jgi:gamma-glutamyl:cysteine ligase YbdK (ATP-grasp superfamily)
MLDTVRAIKSKSDSNKVWIYVGVGIVGHMIARSQGSAVPLRDQVNRALQSVNARHNGVGVGWYYEKETLVAIVRS